MTLDLADRPADAAPHALDDWFLAAPFRAHVGLVIDQARTTWRHVAIAAEVPVPAVRTLLFGRPRRPPRLRICGRTAQRLLEVSAMSFARDLTFNEPARHAHALARQLLRRGASAHGITTRAAVTVDEVADVLAGASTCPRRVRWELQVLTSRLGLFHEPVDLLEPELLACLPPERMAA